MVDGPGNVARRGDAAGTSHGSREDYGRATEYAGNADRCGGLSDRKRQLDHVARPGRVGGGQAERVRADGATSGAPDRSPEEVEKLTPLGSVDFVHVPPVESANEPGAG